MEKIYKAHFDIQSVLFTIPWSILGGSFLTLAIMLFIPPLRGKVWILPVFIATLMVLGVYRFIALKSYYLILQGGHLILHSRGKIEWSIPVTQITEIDKTQGHIWRKYRWQLSKLERIGFLVLADGKEYAVYQIINNYNQLITDLKELNPNIQLTDLTVRSDREYIITIRQAEARNEYNPDDPFSKVFSKWLPPQIIVWGAAILIVILVGLGIYYTVVVSQYK